MNVELYIKSISPAMKKDRWRKREEDNIKTWTPRDREELFRWNKKHFIQYFKDFLLVKYGEIADITFNWFFFFNFGIIYDSILFPGFTKCLPL